MAKEEKHGMSLKSPGVIVGIITLIVAIVGTYVAYDIGQTQIDIMRNDKTNTDNPTTPPVKDGDNQTPISKSSGLVLKPETHTVKILPDAQDPLCDETNGCINPQTLKIRVGDTVRWENDVVDSYTITGGDAKSGPNRTFSSGLINDTYSFEFIKEGEYPYFDMNHPWVSGMIIAEP
ncbi:MAG: hypothetical protein KC444_09785 [Nitrosopumilus sp.]|nr:hypothetical protein [Nitrosopumilus sp.]